MILYHNDAFRRQLVREQKLFARGDAEKAGDIQSELRAYQGADEEVVALGRAKAMVDVVNAKNPGRVSLVMLTAKMRYKAMLKNNRQG